MAKIIKFDNEELLALARFDIKNDDLEPALLKLKTILASSEVSNDAIQITAQLYAQLGLFEKAEQLFMKCLDNDSHFENVRFQLGMTLFDQNKVDDALSNWLEVLEKDEFHPPALFYTGLVFAQKGETQKAVKYLQLIIDKINSDNLYFSRAHELLQGLKNGMVGTQGASSDNISNTINTDAYKTIQ